MTGKIPLYRTLDIVKVVNTDLTNDGLEIGVDYIIVATRAFPISETDPYTQRVKLLVRKLNTDRDGTEGKIYIVDPSSVEHTGLMAVDDAATN